MLIDRSFDAPAIHVMSQSPRLEMLQARLRRAGLRPIAARGRDLPADAAPVLIDQVMCPTPLAVSENRLLITLGPDRAKSGGDIHLSDIEQLATLPARIAIREREKQRRREFALRARTAGHMGSRVPDQASKPTRLLWLGSDAPFLNGLKSCLKAQGVDMVAALSRLTAEDYLASGRFDLLVLCPSKPQGEALRLLARLNSYVGTKTPRTVLLLRPGTHDYVSSEQAGHADLIIDLPDSVDYLAEQLTAFGTVTHTTPSPPHRLQSSPLQDIATGLASRAYLEQHLQAQMEQAERLAKPLTCLAIALPSSSTVRAVAAKIAPLLRDTDLAARLDSQHICISMPETPYRGAVQLARRIEAHLGAPLTWRAVERRRFHTRKTMLGSLVAKPRFSRQKTG